MTDTSRTRLTGRVSLQDLLADPQLDRTRVEQIRLEMERQVDGYALREVRFARGVTQRELAKRLGVSQNRISAIEKGQFHKAQLGTISRYVEALGGELIVQAQINGQRIQLS